MTDKKRLENLIRDWGLRSYSFKERRFLSSTAWGKGARLSISIEDVDFYFTLKGSLVGTATTQRGSWRKRRRNK